MWRQKGLKDGLAPNGPPATGGDSRAEPDERERRGEARCGLMRAAGICRANGREGTPLIADC